MLYMSQYPALRLELVGQVTMLEERAREESDDFATQYLAYIVMVHCGNYNIVE